jgi:hypothetical protein
MNRTEPTSDEKLQAERKAYHSPEFRIYGSVRDLTLTGGVANMDQVTPAAYSGSAAY